MRAVQLLVALAVAAIAAADAGAAAPLVRHVERADGHGDRLLRVDPRTLRPVSPGLPTFLDGFSGGFSPDGRLFAYGNGFDGRAVVQLIDVRSWSTLERLDLGGDGPVALFWAASDRLILVAGEGSAGPRRLLVVSVPGGQVLARRTFRGTRLADAMTPLGLVLLMAPERRMGAARILLAGVDGGVRSIELPRIRAGGDDPRRSRARFRAPGLAVDPEGRVAYVIGAGPMLAARIDLVSGGVEYHRLRPLGSAGRAVAAKAGRVAWWRQAAWLGDGRIAVTGDYEAPFRPRGASNRPFGVRLVDTRDWTIRTLHPGATLMYQAGEHLLANGTTWYAGSRRSESTGLLAFDRRGRRAFTRFRGADVYVLGGHGRLAYVWVRPTRMLHVLDLRSGNSLRRERVGPAHLPSLFSPSG
jgi:hypothetical protein